MTQYFDGKRWHIQIYNIIFLIHWCTKSKKGSLAIKLARTSPQAKLSENGAQDIYGENLRLGVIQSPIPLCRHYDLMHDPQFLSFSLA